MRTGKRIRKKWRKAAEDKLFEFDRPARRSYRFFRIHKKVHRYLIERVAVFVEMTPETEEAINFLISDRYL